MSPYPQADFDTGVNNLPCRSQIAFASLVVRLKPAHLSIEEHLQYLRSAIFEERSPSLAVGVDFNPLVYWEQVCRNSEQQRIDLLDEVARLKEEVEVLRREPAPVSPTWRGTLGKRKRGDPTAQNSAERPEITSEDIVHAISDDDPGSDNGRKNSDGAARQDLLRGLFSLQHTLRLRKTNKKALMAAIQTVAMTLCRDLQPANKDNASGSTQEEIWSAEELESIVKETYPPILHGLELLRPDTDEEGQVVFHAVPDVVMLFESILGRLHNFAQYDVARRGGGVTLQPRARGCEADLDRTGPLNDTEEESSCKIITKTLIRMVLLLDLSRDAHCEVLEGILCALLDHIGSLLSLLVFSDSSGRAEGVIGILPPKGLVDAADEDLESAVESAKMEGPYLICILRKATEFLQSNTKFMSKRGLLFFSRRNATGDRDLQQYIEETLQNTLLRGVFGDDDDTFHNSLRRSERNVEPDLKKLMQEITPDASSSEWFIGQLWEHLGWSILSGRRAR